MFRRTPPLLSSKNVAPSPLPRLTNINPPPPKSQQPLPFHPSHLLRYIYDPSPNPLNPTTLTPTRDFAQDPSHPYHIKTIRKLAAFDKEKLHWRVQCPVDLSKRAFVRSWAAKRVGRVLRKKVEEARGRDDDGGGVGTGLERNGAGEEGKRGPAAAAALRGALLVMLVKEPIALTASDEQVRWSVEWVLERVREKQGRNVSRPKQRTKPPSAPTPKRDREVAPRPPALSSSPLLTPSTPPIEPLTPAPAPAPLDPALCRKQLEFYFSDANLRED